MSNHVRTSPATDHRRKPRKKRAPSGRDQAILLEHRTRGRSIAELAKEYGLSASRISQIIRRVEKWRANLDPAAEGQLNEHQQRHLERWLMREKYQAIYDRAIRAFDQAPKELTTTRIEWEGEVPAEARNRQRDGETARRRDGGTKDDCPLSPSLGHSVSPSISHPQPKKSILTTRQHIANVQLLKVAHRTTTDLGRLAELEPLPAAADQTREDKRASVEELLIDLLYDAIVNKLVRSTGWFDERDFVEDLLKFLLGEPHRGLATTIIAEDAERGRRRDNKQPHSCRDKMRTGTPTQAPSASEGVTERRRDGETEGQSNQEPFSPSLGPSVSPSNASNPASGQSPEVEPPPADSAKTPAVKTAASNASKTSEPTRISPRGLTRAPERVTSDAAKFPKPGGARLGTGLPTPPDKSTEIDPELEAYLHVGVPYEDARRAVHCDKIRKLQEALAAGRPCLISLDPADGPLPSLEPTIGDFGWRPTPRDREAEATRVQEYLATLRAQEERKGQEFLKPQA